MERRPITSVDDEAAAAADVAARAIGARLAALHVEIAERAMRDLPICNPALAVEAVGFRAVGGRAVGILLTPWFMNLVVAALPGGAPLPAAAPGDGVDHVLPGGVFPALVGDLSGFGRLDGVSLFSPMFEFADHATARAAAEAALAAILEPEPDADARPAGTTAGASTATMSGATTAATGPTPTAGLDRRTLLFGRRAETRGGVPCP